MNCGVVIIIIKTTDLTCHKSSYKDTVHSATMSLLIKQISFEVFLKTQIDDTLVTDGGRSLEMRAVYDSGM